MKTSNYPLFTIKEKPKNTISISQELMLRSGIIRKSSSGLYIWLPIGLKILKKIKKIIRKEMKKCGGIEICMPFLQKSSIWKKSGRLKLYGKELFKIYDRKKKKFILSPTNEEFITNFVKKNINHFNKFPILIFQIQNKFRDEIRPKNGVIRCKEFFMKDAYSFHKNKKSLKKTYKKIYNSYKKIFKKLQIKFKIIKADSGIIGDSISHEFQALSKNGENSIVLSTKSNYSENINFTPIKKNINKIKKKWKKNIKNKIFKKIKLTKKIKNKKKIIKTYLIQTKKKNKNKYIIILLKKKYKINKNKIKNIFKPIIFINKTKKIKIFNYKKNNLNYINVNYPIITDASTAKMKNFIIKSNINNKYYKNVNWIINLPKPKIMDIRNIKNGDRSPDGKGKVIIKKGIEIGHIFQLKKKYSKLMNLYIKKNNNKKYINMGCYGIGITRIVATIIEQNNDKKGIIWPDSVTPFNIAIIPILINKNKKIKKTSKELYNKFKKKNIDVLLYNNNERIGVIFSNIELIGIPHIIIISNRYIKKKKIEYQNRKNKTKKIIKISAIKKYILKKINS
ncbi:proline--tRNA ligase [Buchnera aphidicola]|uniref:proline--tRNA ligase n=1 Tax=Buchnera aphidicola TaxID=9 RepID=UPI0031B8A6C1